MISSKHLIYEYCLIQSRQAFPLQPPSLINTVKFSLCYDFGFFKPVTEFGLLIKLFISLSTGNDK